MREPSCLRLGEGGEQVRPGSEFGDSRSWSCFQGGEGQRCDCLSGVGGLVPRMSSQDLSSARPTGYLV